MDAEKTLVFALRVWRLAEDITQEEAAELLSLTERAYGSLERNEAKPSFDTLVNVLQAMGINLAQLLEQYIQEQQKKISKRA